MPDEPTVQAPDAAPTPIHEPAPTAKAEADLTQIPAGNIDALLSEALQIDQQATSAAAIDMPPVTAPTPAPAPAPEPETPPAEPAAPAEPVATDEPPSKEKILPGRINPGQFDDTAQRGMVMHRELNAGRKQGDPGYVTLAEAIQMVADTDARANPAPTHEPAAPAPTAKVTEIQGNLDTLEGQLAEYQREPDQWGEEIKDLRAQIRQANSDLVDAKVAAQFAVRDEQARQAQAAETKDQAIVTARQASLVNATQKYPSLGTRGSPLREASNALATALKDPTHPDHHILADVNASEWIADTAARQVAGQMVKEGKAADLSTAYEALKAKPTAAAPTPPTPTPEARKILPGVGGPTPVAAPVTETDLLNLKPNQISQLLDSLSPEPFILGK